MFSELPRQNCIILHEFLFDVVPFEILELAMRRLRTLKNVKPLKMLVLLLFHLPIRDNHENCLDGACFQRDQTSQNYQIINIGKTFTKQRISELAAVNT